MFGDRNKGRGCKTCNRAPSGIHENLERIEEYRQELSCSALARLCVRVVGVGIECSVRRTL